MLGHSSTDVPNPVIIDMSKLKDTMDDLSNTLVSRSPSFKQNGLQETQPSSSTQSSDSQATQRVNRKYPDVSSESEEKQSEQKSLMEKLQDHYHQRPVSGNKSKYSARFWFQFQAITQFYMTMVYLIPFIFADFSDMTQYYVKVFISYFFVVTEANWLSSICYRSFLPDPRDKPNLDYNNWFENPPNIFGQKDPDATTNRTCKNGLVWKFCDVCNWYKPPRSHHCNFCKTCILRRDHHCYLIGNCIGHYNQRYFIVLCFYTILASAVGFPMTCYYLSSLPDATWWGDYALPYTVLQFFYGNMSWQFVILTFHSHMLVLFGVLSATYFLGQLSIVSMGKTLYEVAKQVEMRVTTSTSDNFRLVFGDYWFLSFLFPAQILFKQRSDGINYEGVKIYENSDTKK